MTKLSIIIPYHNVENYIAQCLESVIFQSVRDIEIICVNDSSDDKSEQIVKDYALKDNRIIMLNSEGVRGQAHARNIAFDIAKGEYVGFVDSDDWVEHSMFEKLYNKAKFQDTDITMCLAKLYDDTTGEYTQNDYYDLKSLEKFGSDTFRAIDTEEEILNINVVLWNKIYKREFLEKTQERFPAGYIYEDLPFFYATYLKAQKVNVVWEHLYYYRQNRKYSTMQNTDKKVYDRIPMVELTYNILKKASFFNERRPFILSWIIDDIFHRYTLLEDKYYEDFYASMKEFFRKIELTQEDRDYMAKSYCVDEFNAVVELSYQEFWGFLIEKYRSSNKRIKAAEHKCNLDIIAIKEFWENYKQQKEEEISLLNQDIWSLHKQMVDQEYELKRWQAQSQREQKEKLTADYEWKIENQKQRYEEVLKNQKEYYENNFLLVKMSIKMRKMKSQIKNKIKKFLKKN